MSESLNITTKHFYLDSEKEQMGLAAHLANVIVDGSVIYLKGDLGAGKTTFVRGFLQGLGYQGVVKSPTYTLVEPYHVANKRIFHFDLYRLAEPDELEYAGGRDYFDEQSICLVEWPEQAEGFLPIADIQCQFSYQKAGRCAELQANTENGKSMLVALSY